MTRISLERSKQSGMTPRISGRFINIFESWMLAISTGPNYGGKTNKVHIIEANGASYRLEESRKRLTRRKKRSGQN